MPLYLGELSGARVVRMGTGVTDATAASTQSVLMDVTTHPEFPAGTSGDAVLHAIHVVLKHSAGYTIGITPIVDGVSGTEQTFNASAPAAGTDGLAFPTAYVRSRGTGFAARVRQTSGSNGTVELVDVACEGVVLRSQP